jgi:hypothetical protein
MPLPRFLELPFWKRLGLTNLFFLRIYKRAMALTLLRRSDSNLALAAATEDPAGLAESLSEQQAFTVSVFATFSKSGWALPALQRCLKEAHVQNGWFALAPEEVFKALCEASLLPCSDAAEDQEVYENEGRSDANQGEADAIEELAASVEPAWHDLLQPCTKEQADKATVIRKALAAELGALPAAALLSNYREAVLRLPGKGSQRFIVDCKGEARRLAFEGAGCQIGLAA